jgi:hypothetical protein
MAPNIAERILTMNITLMLQWNVSVILVSINLARTLLPAVGID